MGPSGSGKSSLLTLMGGRSAARTTGSLCFNGQPLNKAMKRRMGFVTQDDLLFAELTTYETLHYAAMLRLPKSWTRAQKEDRVEMVLKGLGLDKCRDTIIGNHSMCGVSGGERKRVSIGHELLINPSVILLDEPTSGLDSTTALKLVHTLRQLAHGGRTIIASIHQPSSRLYQEFDKLMLLADGHTMYYGDAHACTRWFHLQVVPVPYGVSVPDHLLDLACGFLTGGTTPAQAAALQGRLVKEFERRTFGLGPNGIQPEDFKGLELDSPTCHGAGALPLATTAALQQHQHGGAWKGAPRPGHEQHELCAQAGDGGAAAPAHEADVGKRASSSSIPAGGLLEPTEAALLAAPAGPKVPGGALVVGNGPSGPAVNGGKLPGSKCFVSDAAVDDLDCSKAAGEEGLEADGNLDAEEDKWGATWAQQVAILTSRFLRTRRFQALSVQRFAEVTLTAILTGLFWFQVGGTQTLTDEIINNINGLVFFQVIFMSFSTLFQSLFTFPTTAQMLVKERQSGMFKLSAYYAALSLTDLPMDCAIPTLFQIIIYFMAGLRLSAGAYFGNLLGMLLALLLAQSIGLFLSATISHPKTLISTASVFMLATMLVAGFFVKAVPSWISWAKYLSFARYGYILLQKVEFGGRGYSCADYYAANPTAPPGLTWCPVSGSGLVPSNVDNPVTLEVCVLLGTLVVMRLAVYWSLARRTTFKINSS